MYCRKCGTQNSEGSLFCTNCGERLVTVGDGEVINTTENVVEPPVQEITQAPVYVNETSSTNSVADEEKNSILWGVLGFFIPIVGIILFFVWLKSKPKSSKSSLFGALIGIVVSLLATITLFAVGILSLDKIFDRTPSVPTGNVDNPTPAPVVEVKKYEVGDAVTTVDGSKWHVIGVKGDTLTLLLDELVVEETGYGTTASEEDQKYVNSNVKKYIDETYTPALKSKIDAAGGDSSEIVGRIMSMEEYLEITMSKFDDNYYTTSYKIEAYDKKEEVCKMVDILALTKSFWTSSNVRDYNPTGSYYGVIYIKRGDVEYDYFCEKSMPDTYAIVDIATDGHYQMGATLVGIRPVIETPKTNIK